ncbi:MAG: hypothetical protein N2422_05670 [Rhodobacteraceae bacterium]|nr:hypothetical protein [Paracoccaceae bacterium]
MAVSGQFVARFSTEDGRRLKRQAVAGRRRALSAITHFAVTLTDDGTRTWEEIFQHPPTLAQLQARVGENAFVVAVQMRRRARRSRSALPIAAE